MRITLINGSPRVAGATGKILSAIRRQLAQKADAEIHYINLAELKMKFCKGCYQCYRQGKCIITDDDLEALAELIQKSDGLIIGSPTYASDVHALVKNVIDRCHFVLEQQLDGKYCFAVSTYANYGGAGVLQTLNSLFETSGGIVCGHYLEKLYYNRPPLQNPSKKQALERQIEAFYQRIKEKRGRSWVGQLRLAIIRRTIRPLLLKDPGNHLALRNLWARKGLL